MTIDSTHESEALLGIQKTTNNHNPTPSRARAATTTSPAQGAEAAPSNETNSESTERRRRRRGSRGGTPPARRQEGDEALPLEAENAEGPTGAAAAPPRALRSSAAPRELDFDSGRTSNSTAKLSPTKATVSTAPLLEASAAAKVRARRPAVAAAGADRAAIGPQTAFARTVPSSPCCPTKTICRRA
jgi:hypothetical protein